MVMHLHAKYHKPMWKNKKSLGRTRFGPDARTDRVITIGRPPQSGGALINNHFRRQWWSIKMPRTRWQFVTVKSLIWPCGQSSRSKVTNNGTRHIAWRWSTYMPNMKSLSWTTKKLQHGHNLLRTQGLIWPWGQNSRSMVKGHQQWYATHRLEVVYLHVKYEKSVLNDKKGTARTRFVMDADQFDLEVKVQGQR